MVLPVIGAWRPWEDPRVTDVGRLPIHVPLVGFETITLDGPWNFTLFDTPDGVPESAITGDPAPTTVAVPGNWTMQVAEDHPHYTNVQMPFPGPPPALPERNPTGVYRRTVTLPEQWLTNTTVLHVGGAESVHAVYVNQHFAGYGTDSRLPSEYDISEFVVAGVNEIAVVVVRYSAHSYMEDQDQWWMAGLHRSVRIESRPRVHFADIVVNAEPDEGLTTAAVDVTNRIRFGTPPAPGWTVRTTLFSPNGKAVGKPHVGEVPTRFEAPMVFTGFAVRAQWTVRSPKLWSAETPARYTVTSELLDPGGSVIHTERQLIGIRSVVVRDRQLLVNGQPIWIFGVNRHDHHPDRGKALDAECFRADLLTMRRNNITAIRTSHYPNDDAFYDLCDELGFYLIDEANLESHAYNTSLCNDDRFRPSWVERGARMVTRDRNHPCVIVWSLGNESGYGVNHDALAGWIRRADPTRPLHYEGATFHGDHDLTPRGVSEQTGRVDRTRLFHASEANPAWADGGLRATDIVCPMYPQIEAIEQYGADGRGSRPLIMCEYSHAMGNSNGSLAEYWDVITSTPGLQGGFIWEWKDHGLRRTLNDGTTRLAYGGDFGDTPNDGNFVADGLVSADGLPHPGIREVAWVYRPITVALAAGRARRLVISNRQSFLGLEPYTATWELLVAGHVTESGTLRTPPVAAHSSVTVPLPCSIQTGRDEVHLRVMWSTKKPTWFADAGHLVAWDEIELRAARAPRSTPVRSSASLQRSAVDDLLTLPIELALWRATTDNDGYKLMPRLSEEMKIGGQKLRTWRAAGVDRLPADQLVEHTIEHIIEANGTAVRARHRVVVPDHLADLPRIGVRFAVPGSFTALRWFGRGPHENYPDRKAGAMLGIWSSAPDEPPYLVPQEFGLRTDVRWMECSEPDGRLLRIEALVPHSLHMSATNYRAEDLFAAANEADLRPRDELLVHLDVAHRGLGTASCGPDVRRHHRLAAGVYEFEYRLTLVQSLT